MKKFIFSKFAGLQTSSFNKNELVQSDFSRILSTFQEQPLKMFWNIWVLENNSRKNSKFLKMQATLFKNYIE